MLWAAPPSQGVFPTRSCKFVSGNGEFSWILSNLFWPTSYYEWCEMDEGNYPQLFMLAPYCNSSRCIMYDANSHAACDGPLVGAYLPPHSMVLCLRIFTSKNMLACSIVVSITIIMTKFTAHLSKYPKKTNLMVDHSIPIKNKNMIQAVIYAYRNQRFLDILVFIIFIIIII